MRGGYLELRCAGGVKERLVSAWFPEETAHVRKLSLKIVPLFIFKI